MKPEDIKKGMILRNKKTGRIGVPFTGYDYGCIDESIEVAIVYQGNDEKPEGAPPFIGTAFENLEPHELKSEDLLTKEHIDKVCKPSKEGACAYLTVGADGFDCAKVSGDTSIAHKIDDRLREGTMRATGNNCGGRYKSRVIEGN